MLLHPGQAIPGRVLQANSTASDTPEAPGQDGLTGMQNRGALFPPLVGLLFSPGPTATKDHDKMRHWNAGIQ